jgi:hypothetical protein
MRHRVRRAAWGLAPVAFGLTLGCASRPDPVSGDCAARQGALVPFTNGVTNAAFVGETLYFDSNDDQRISRVSLAGGAIEALVDGGATGEWGAGGGVFAWETEPVHATPQSATYVDQFHIRDQAGVVHDFPPSSNGGVTEVQVDGAGNVYWRPPDNEGVARWDHSTQQETVLANAGLRLVDETQLYWVSADQTSILSMATSGGDVRTLATLDAPSGSTIGLVASDADTLYVTQLPPIVGPSLGGFSPAQIKGIPKRGGAPFLVADNTAPFYSNVVADDTHLYWVTVPPGTGDYVSELDVVRTTKSGGGSVEQVASTKAWIAAIGVDACNVYAVTKDGLVAYAKPGSIRLLGGARRRLAAIGRPLQHDRHGPIGPW